MMLLPPRPSTARVVCLSILLAGMTSTDTMAHVDVVTAGSIRRPVRVSATSLVSQNWAGYVATGHTFGRVIARWTQPAISCTPTSDAAVSFWIGLDGYTADSGTVEQTGTAASCIRGKPRYSAWWEIYPQVTRQVVFTPNPGDSMTASVLFHRSPDHFTFTETDVTTGQSLLVSQACQSTCIRSSAEWITEAPSSTTGTIHPLADFGSVRFANGKASSGGVTGSISGWPHVKIDMVDSTHTITKASTSALDTTGTMFSVTWKHS